MILCKFLAQRFCKNGELCYSIHESSASIGQHLAPLAPVLPTTVKLTNPGGWQNNFCPYLHVTDELNVENSSSQDLETTAREQTVRRQTVRRQTVRRQTVASLTFVEARINLIAEPRAQGRLHSESFRGHSLLQCSRSHSQSLFPD